MGHGANRPCHGQIRVVAGGQGGSQGSLCSVVPGFLSIPIGVRLTDSKKGGTWLFLVIYEFWKGSSSCSVNRQGGSRPGARRPEPGERRGGDGDRGEEAAASLSAPVLTSPARTPVLTPPP